jgi:hypothetical protein
MKFLVCVEGMERLYFAFSGRPEAESFANLPREEGQVATVFEGPAGVSGPALATGLLAAIKDNRVPWQISSCPADPSKGSLRLCLRCGGVFGSKGITNRICAKCKNRRQ